MTIEGTHGLWADLAIENSDASTADAIIFGIPFDGLASARQGARFAPQKMRQWSKHLTPFSEDRTRLLGVRLTDLGDFVVNDPEVDYPDIQKRLLSYQSIQIGLGGDHSVAIPMILAALEKNPQMALLWVDAHPDLCDVFDGSRLSHASVLRRILDAGLKPENVCMIGLRSWEEQELDLIETAGFTIFTAAQVADLGIKSILPSLQKVFDRCDGVYLSFDIDALDPSFAPGTGIPEFGGISSRDALTMIKMLESYRLVGMDLVEVAPPLDLTDATVFAGLKILMEYIAVIARRKN